MSRLPLISGREAVRKFVKLGYRAVRQRGSHIRLIHPSDASRKPLTIPDHNEVGKGLLHKLIRDAGISLEEFFDLLEYSDL